MAQQPIPEKWAQAYAPKDLKSPTHADKLLEEAVEKFSVRQVKREALKDLKRKERVLQELESIFNAWVRQCAVEAGVGTEVNGVPVAGRLETSGSWKLAIHEKDADIDCVCVAPQFCSLELFFGPFSAMLKAHKDVTNFLPIPGAFVPIMTFDLREVNIDLLLAVLPDVKTVPRSLDILDDGLLGGMEEKSRRSINGPRDTLTLIKLIRSAGSRVLNPSDADERYDAFLRTVRVLRLWAKRRCLYSNKMGYLGGINFNIMLTMVIQFYPRKSPGCLLAKFFETLALWERKILTVPEVSEAEARHSGVLWRHPVRLCAELRGVAQRLDKEVYPETSFGVNWGAMPVVTPSYPAYNSTGNVNPWTLRVMNEELQRAMAITKQCEQIAAEEEMEEKERGHTSSSSSSSSTAAAAAAASAERIGSLLDELVQPADFFWRADHVHFLAVHVTCEGGFYQGGGEEEGGTNNDDSSGGGGGSGKGVIGVNPAFASFKRLCEPMFRNLISAKGYKNLGDYESMTRIHLLPKVFEGMPLDPPFKEEETKKDGGEPVPTTTTAAEAAATAVAAVADSAVSDGGDGGVAGDASGAAAENDAAAAAAAEAAAEADADAAALVAAAATQQQQEKKEEEEAVAVGNASLTMWVAFVQDNSALLAKGMKKERLELGTLVEAFQTQVRDRFERDPEGFGQSEHMCIRPRLFKHEQLPPWVFDLGEIGRERALELRAQQKKDIKRRKKQQQQQLQQVGAAASATPASVLSSTTAVAVAAAATAATDAGDFGKKALMRDDDSEAAAGTKMDSLVTSNTTNTAADANIMNIKGAGGVAEKEQGAVGKEAARAAAAAVEAAAAQAVAKPLWVAVADAHLALPTLASVGDFAVRNPLTGLFVQGFADDDEEKEEVGGGHEKGGDRGGKQRSREKEVEAGGHPEKRMRHRAVLLPAEEEEEWARG